MSPSGSAAARSQLTGFLSHLEVGSTVESSSPAASAAFRRRSTLLRISSRSRRAASFSLAACSSLAFAFASLRTFLALEQARSQLWYPVL